MSGDLIPISEEWAKLGQEVVKALRGLGGFVEKALGSTPENLIGYLFGDRLTIRRAEAFVRLMEEARSHLQERGVEDVTPATLSIVLPILNAAVNEDRDQLMDLWSRLLASSLDRATREKVRRSYIEAIQEMDPMDVSVIHHIHQAAVSRIRVGDGGDLRNTSIVMISKRIQAHQDDVEVSIRHLERLEMLVTAPNDKSTWFPSAKLREFMRACYYRAPS